MRIHVLGVGSIGTLLSHQLRRTLQPAAQYPISLHVRSRSLPKELRGGDERGRRRSSGPEDARSRTRAGPADGARLHPKVELLVRDTAGTVTPASPFEITLSPHPHSGPILREPSPSPFPLSTTSSDPIDSLLVTLKCPATLPAIAAIKHRIRPDSVVTLVQNGMGVYDELCERVWPDAEERPQFILGTTTHGVTMDRRRWVYRPDEAGDAAAGGRLRKLVLLQGEGDIKYSVVPDPRGQVDYASRLFPEYAADPASFRLPPASPSLPLPSLSAHDGTSSAFASPLETTLATLLSMRALRPSLLPIAHMHHQLLLKLVVNAIINPITAVLGIKNGQLIGNHAAHKLVREVADECSFIMLAYLGSLHDRGASHLPAPPGVDLATRAIGASALPPDVIHRFSPRALESLALDVASKTARNTSSMLGDVLRGQQTEIEYINGYLVGLGQRMGVPTATNALLMSMVKAKQGSMLKSR